MQIVENLLPYCERLQHRDPSTIELVVIHCTELPDMRLARQFGERIMYEQSGTGVSGHYYVDRDGTVYRFVPEERVANHVLGFNDKSIGIELVNLGRYPSWFSSHSQTPAEPYPSEQIQSLKDLMRDLRQRLTNLKNIVRHSDLDQNVIPAEDNQQILIRRKIDPGPQFPWEDVARFWQELQ